MAFKPHNVPHNFTGTKKICRICQREFFLSPSRVKTKFYCSQKCYGEAQQSYVPHRYKRITVKGTRVYEHRWILEQKLKRKLLLTEHVHHINGLAYDNRPENLEAVDIREHAKFSNLQRLLNLEYNR